jgi:hypothetical protein
MDTLPLPPRPDLENYRKRAKSLVAVARSGDRDAIRAWANDWLTALTHALGWEITPFIQGSFDRALAQLTQDAIRRIDDAGRTGQSFSLADAQRLIATVHGFDSWARFSEHVRRMTAVDPEHADFEAAADAVVTGEIERLRTLLERNPGLVHQHSHRKHHATLLHYVAANGVEDFRQKTPPNAMDIAELLLDAGAVVDALADTYSRDQYQTTMNLLVSSTHPAEAGLQSALVELLLDRGAAIDGLANDSSPIMTALAFGYRDAAETLVRRGARIANVTLAAAVGRLDLVRDWVIDRNTLRREEPLRVPYWVNIPADAPGQIARSLVLACRFGRADVAHYLLELGVSCDSADQDDMTALHWASASGLHDVMRILIERGAPLEARNRWGGTVLDSTMWFAVNFPANGVDYARVARQLLAAGADPDEVTPFPTGVTVFDNMLAAARTTT